jgi:hypothetical protein
MNYRTIFDVSDSPFLTWQVSLVCVGLVLTGICLTMLRRWWSGWFFWPRAVRQFANPFALFYLAGTIILAAIIISTSFSHRRVLISALNARQYGVVEGRATHFVPAPYEGHQDEQFCVESTCFSYSDYVVTGGFNQTSSHGGPMQEGLPVRVSFLGNIIIKLEKAN